MSLSEALVSVFYLFSSFNYDQRSVSISCNLEPEAQEE